MPEKKEKTRGYRRISVVACLYVQTSARGGRQVATTHARGNDITSVSKNPKVSRRRRSFNSLAAVRQCTSLSTTARAARNELNSNRTRSQASRAVEKIPNGRLYSVIGLIIERWKYKNLAWYTRKRILRAAGKRNIFSKGRDHSKPSPL